MNALDQSRAVQLGARADQMGFEVRISNDGSLILARDGDEFFFAGGIVQALEWLHMQ